MTSRRHTHRPSPGNTQHQLLTLSQLLRRPIPIQPRQDRLGAFPLNDNLLDHPDASRVNLRREPDIRIPDLFLP